MSIGLKMKTKSSVMKRIKITATGKIKRGNAFTSHIAQTKTQKKKRHARKYSDMSSSDFRRLKRLISR